LFNKGEVDGGLQMGGFQPGGKDMQRIAIYGSHSHGQSQSQTPIQIPHGKVASDGKHQRRWAEGWWDGEWRRQLEQR